jgi:hypothetical protein
MRAIRWTTAFAAVVGLVLLMAASVPARSTAKLYTVNASSFTSNGDPINGWSWLRSNAQTAEWIFDVSGVQGAKRNQVYINFTVLVTKGVNGSSGYSGGLSIKFVGLKTVTSSVSLVNPFRPREYTGNIIGDTSGMGYQAYGAASVPFSAYDKATTLKVIVARANSSATKNLHLAVQKESPVIAFVK